MAMLRRYLPIAVVAAFVLALSVGAIASTDESNPPSAGVPQITEIEPAASEAMSVFERARGSADALRADLAAKMDSHADFGMNPGLSRVSIGNATNSLYAVPARGRVCAVLTVGEGANVTCPPTADIAGGQAAPATVVLATGDIAVYGLVPDGVDSVSVQTETTESTAVATQDNGYYTVVPAGTRLRTVRYGGPSGQVEFPIYDPSLVMNREE
jgi:hypothetical protein